MFPYTTYEPSMSAAEARSYLSQLESELALAEYTGLSAAGSYMADLEGEIESTRAFYVGAAVTEIASLRGELSGPHRG